jgi:hypothetical protein
MSAQFIIVKERNHVHMDAVEETGLVDRYIDRVIPGFEQEVRFFRGFDPCGQKDGPPAGSADSEITVPLVDIFNHFRNNRDLP